ncbi:MAG: hypothetical protein QOF44_4628, partial [Streptomyces sp.]|nr:hypothetical protein [Streptomyces sp.]
MSETSRPTMSSRATTLTRLAELEAEH